MESPRPPAARPGGRAGRPGRRLRLAGRAARAPARPGVALQRLGGGEDPPLAPSPGADLRAAAAHARAALPGLRAEQPAPHRRRSGGLGARSRRPGPPAAAPDARDAAGDAAPDL